MYLVRYWQAKRSKWISSMFATKCNISLLTAKIVLQWNLQWIKTNSESALSFLHPYINHAKVQVNLCQKLLFLHQLTHNMTTCCSLNYKFNTWKFQAQNMARTCCVHKLFWMSKSNSVHKMFSPCLSLEFSCIELVIQWTICRHIVG